MDEKTMNFNENQLKRTGFAEAFTPDLQEKMKQGVPYIQHAFKKEYDGDEVNATLHLKKSTTSDHYFLNKFDIQVKKDGQTNSTDQTFYIFSRKIPDEDGGKEVKQDNHYTLKEAYNLLAGRPVFKHLVSNEGKEYEAWVKLDLKTKLVNGNHELKQYTKNYGFDLQDVLAKYAIKELANEQFKNSLIDSLQRGNLQKATFVDKDGKEEKMYISPNITLGSLNILDENKERVTTEKLVEKNFIGQELAKDLKERYAQQPMKDTQKSATQTDEMKDKKLEPKQKIK